MKRFQKLSLVFALGASILCADPMIQSVYAAEATNTDITIEKVYVGEGLPSFAQQIYETNKERVIIKNYQLKEGQKVEDIPTESFEVDGYTYKYDGIDEVVYPGSGGTVYEVTFISPKSISERAAGAVEVIAEMETPYKVSFTMAGIALVAVIVLSVIRFKNRKEQAN